MLYLDEAILERKSTRNFMDIPVENSKILQILNAGRLAPSAKNRQPWFFHVISTQQKKEISELLNQYANQNALSGTENETAKIINSAPIAIAVMLKSTSISDYISLGACLENMSLKAVDLGLGSLIVCDTQCIENLLTNLFGNGKFAALFIIGYPNENIKGKNKKTLAELVSGIEVSNTGVGIIDNFPEANIDSKPFIFISYAHRDAKIVITDICELKKFGVRLWYDRSIYYGETWDEKALSIIDKPNCAGILLYISNNSVQSKNVAKEIEHASHRFGKELQFITVHIGDKAISSYPISQQLANAFSLIPDTKKYIPRLPTIGSVNALPIVAAAERLGAVDSSDVYDKFSFEACEDGMRITSYNGCSKIVNIVSNISGIPVVAIGKNAFRGNNVVEKVIIPNTVKRIEEGAFFGMKELQSVDMPNTMDYLGVAAFRGCSKIKTINLPLGITVLSEAMFRECSSLIECDIPNTVVEFGEAVFRNCSSLKRVSMRSVKIMTEGGFYGCSSLQELDIDQNIKGLERQSFETCPLINKTIGELEYVNGKAVFPNGNNNDN